MIRLEKTGSVMVGECKGRYGRTRNALDNAYESFMGPRSTDYVRILKARRH